MSWAFFANAECQLDRYDCAGEVWVYTGSAGGDACEGDGEQLPMDDDMAALVGNNNALVVNLSGANSVWVTVGIGMYRRWGK